MYPFMPSPAQQDAGVEERADEKGGWRTREARRIALWRYAQARRLGVEPLQARLFAESAADLGELRALTGRGCAPALAVTIVL